MSTSPTIVVRAHFYDRRVQSVHDIWDQLFPGRVCLLMDETIGAIDTAGCRKISYTLKDSTSLGLPARPKDRAAWHNSDYAVYHLLDQMAKDDFFFLIEYDVFPAVRSKPRWRDMLRDLARFDVVCADFGPRPVDWYWSKKEKVSAYYSKVFGAFVPFFGFNRDAGQFLLERRRRQAGARWKSLFRQWPHCEAFIGTELHGNSGLRVGDIFDLTPTDDTTFGFSRPYLWTDLVEKEPDDRLYHPVLERPAFLNRLNNFMRHNHPSGECYAVIGPFLTDMSATEEKELDKMARRIWATHDFRSAFQGV